MLTFLFTLTAAWTLFWLVMLALDWGNRTSFSDRQILCPTCANALKPGSAATKSGAFDYNSDDVASLHRADIKTGSTVLSESKIGVANHTERDHWPVLKKAS